ncbi:MAG: ribosome biogenesis GTPase YlqF [Methylophilaceae bacterium]|nr:ribosome biogenesis GTPase YlqF [Methylophilaceae bacterium]
MTIQWYPGHMVQARREAEQALAIHDLVIEVLDARLPNASHNPMLDAMRVFRQRLQLKVLNKSDLADPQVTQAWLAHFNAQPNTRAIALSCYNLRAVKKLPQECRALIPYRGTVLKPLRALIMGIPNVGKSTLINALLGKRAAKVGNEPAITKQQQRFELNAWMYITDTPGMMWPKIERESDGYLLAASHAIGRNAMMEEEVAIFLANILLNRYPSLLQARYAWRSKHGDGVSLLEHIAQTRNYKRQHGTLDLDHAAMALLTDYRNGYLGKISLESPPAKEDKTSA